MRLLTTSKFDRVVYGCRKAGKDASKPGLFKRNVGYDSRSSNNLLKESNTRERYKIGTMRPHSLWLTNKGEKETSTTYMLEHVKVCFTQKLTCVFSY